MAVFGVLGDIHGNREGLVAALDALEANGARRIVCVGDVVGYNADPDECVALVRRRCALTIAGNHDLIGLGRLDFRRCSNKAQYSLRRTRRALARESREWLASLPARHELERGVVLVHGGVRDVQQYMVTPGIIRDNAALLSQDFPGTRLCLFGHSHEQKIYAVHGDEVREVPAQGLVRLERNAISFVNPGSVDASRKRGAKFAECAIVDTSAWTVKFLCVRYDAAATEAKAAAFGYRISPLIERLYALQRRLARLPRSS
jgi:predicted phosphodiesterase